jgi:hypothetical protein
MNIDIMNAFQATMARPANTSRPPMGPSSWTRCCTIQIDTYRGPSARDSITSQNIV